MMCIKDTIYSIQDSHLFKQMVNPVSITCYQFACSLSGV